MILGHWEEGREAARARGRSALLKEDILESDAVIRTVTHANTYKNMEGLRRINAVCMSEGRNNESLTPD